MNNSGDEYYCEFEKNNKIFADAIGVSLDLLRKNNFFNDTSDETISRVSAHIGVEIFETIKKMRESFMNESICIDHEKVLVTLGKNDDQMNEISTAVSEIQENPLNIESDDEEATNNYDNSIKKEIDENSDVDCDDSQNNNDNDTNIIEENLNNNGNCSSPNKLTDKITSTTGDSRNERTKIINQWVYAKCIENKKKKITDSLVKCWALEINKILTSKFCQYVKFVPSANWLTQFKNEYHIVGRSNDLKIANQNKQQNKNVVKESLGHSKKTPTKRLILFDEKVKVVNLSRDNPNWSLDMLKEQSECNELTEELLSQWKKEISSDGKIINRRKALNDWVYARCIDYKVNGFKITDKILVNWGLEAKKKFNIHDSQFRAGPKWLKNFKFARTIIGNPTDLKL